MDASTLATVCHGRCNIIMGAAVHDVVMEEVGNDLIGMSPLLTVILQFIQGKGLAKTPHFWV